MQRPFIARARRAYATQGALSRNPARVADALEEQEESDSEGPAVKKYRTMLTADRGAFDKEAARFLRNLRGQRGKARGGRGSCVTAANIKAAW